MTRSKLNITTTPDVRENIAPVFFMRGAKEVKIR